MSHLGFRNNVLGLLSPLKMFLQMAPWVSLQYKTLKSNPHNLLNIYPKPVQIITALYIYTIV